MQRVKFGKRHHFLRFWGGCSDITRPSPIDPRGSWRVVIGISDPILPDALKRRCTNMTLVAIFCDS
jgi:hypothetical protein